MAPQPDQAHEAEENSSESSLLGLINQELLDFRELLDITDAAPKLPLQTPHDNNRNDFVSTPGPRPPRELLGLPTPYVPEPGFIDPRLLDVFNFETAPVPLPSREILDLPVQRVPETGIIHPRLLHTSSQVLSFASDPGDCLIVPTIVDGSSASTRSQQAARARPQGLPGSDVSGARRPVPSIEPRPHIGRSQRRRSCLECRVKQKRCPHRTRIAELTREFINQYDMLFVELGDLKPMIHALYEKVTANTQSYTRPDNSLISMHLVLGEQKSPADPRDEHVVSFDPDRLRRMLLIEGEAYPAVMQPAISVVGFDDFISKKMWSDHGQQPDSRITTAQRNILETMRMFCGYFTLLYNLDEIKIYTEDMQQPTAKLVCIALVALFIQRLCHLYQDLGRNLQALVDKAESNHYFAARILEPIYRCLRLLEWAPTNYPILQQLDDIRRLVNRRIKIVRTEIGGIERDFASPFRGDKRSKNHPTLKAANKFKMSKRLYIHLERRSSRPSTDTLRTRNGRLNMYSVLDLLSSGDIHSIPPDQPLRNSYQPDLPSVNPSLPSVIGQLPTETSTTQTLQALRPHAAYHTQPQPHSDQNNAATRPSTIIDAELEDEDGLFSSGGYTWNFGKEGLVAPGW